MHIDLSIGPSTYPSIHPPISRPMVASFVVDPPADL